MKSGMSFIVSSQNFSYHTLLNQSVRWLPHPSTPKDSGALGPSVDENGLLRLGIGPRYLHLWVNVIQIPFE
jgi:hypothetical protein